ncbi:hypothetical protein [Halonatronum saccharophilum]|uniref:hypothetical protein n=1 Tax=Halonatronum saccharophilum TaxID=150060 RepID=UPI00048A2A7D|nr:hypothetical protein [Halonatronum saccharophilum]
MKEHQQLSLTSDLPTAEDYINKINRMMKEVDKEIRQHPAGSLKTIPLYFEKRRLLKIKQRIEKEGIYI